MNRARGRQAGEQIIREARGPTGIPYRQCRLHHQFFLVWDGTDPSLLVVRGHTRTAPPLITMCSQGGSTKRTVGRQGGHARLAVGGSIIRLAYHHTCRDGAFQSSDSTSAGNSAWSARSVQTATSAVAPSSNELPKLFWGSFASPEEQPIRACGRMLSTRT